VAGKEMTGNDHGMTGMTGHDIEDIIHTTTALLCERTGSQFATINVPCHPRDKC
jgi:hypothetical protein